jgi:hypothetical protein
MSGHPVPFLLPDSERRSPVAAKGLLLCGFIATRQYSLLSTRWGSPTHHFQDRSHETIILKRTEHYIEVCDDVPSRERCFLQSIGN